jgi:hypothetical protein
VSGPFVARCADCDERVSTASPNDVVAFYRRHRAVTGHDVAWERTPTELTVPSSTDIDAVVAALAADADADGVPLGALAAVMDERGWTVGETLAAVHERRLCGALWEPRDDHVAAV